MRRAAFVVELIAIAFGVRAFLHFVPAREFPTGTPYPACTPGIDGCDNSGVRR